MWMCMFPFAAASVVVNEFLPNPDGTDGGLEWVELMNDGPAAVDLTGWVLEAGTSTFGARHTFGTVSIPAGGFLLLGEEFVSADVVMAPGARLSLGNASSSGDALRLVDASGTTVDTIIYGPDNTDGFLDDLGNAPSVLPPAPGSGASLGRSPDGQDTNTAADFVIFPVPTPGAPQGGGTGGCAPAGGVLINEVVVDPPGADADAEWVELWSSQAIDLSGWVIASGTTTYDVLVTLPAGTLLAAGEHLVIGGSLVAGADVVVSGLQFGNASNADAIQLRDCDGGVSDTLVYGAPNDNGWLDDTGGLALGAPRSGSGLSLARQPDGADTNDASVDFAVGSPSPGEPNDVAPPACGGPGSGLVVNELFTNPVGADEGAEWVELYHAGTAPLNLEGWKVQSSTGSAYSDRHVFGALTLAPGERLLIGGESVAGSTHLLSGTLGNGTDGDGVRVVDCTEGVADVVIYGSNNDDALADESGSPATSLAPVPPEGGSVQRIEDGFDTDACGVDFVVADLPSPGLPNPVVEPVQCVARGGDVKVNEIFVDPDGSDTGHEWVELYNAGEQDAVLDGWTLSAGTRDYDNVAATFPVGTTLAPGAWLVVGGSEVPEVQLVVPFTLGNGTSSRDGIRLFDCDGGVVDTVIYGALTEDEPEAGIVDDNGAVVGSYGDPGSQQALARVADGVDTNSAGDWRVARGTPGITNVVEAITPVPQEIPGGCGSKGPREGEPPAGGPSGEAPTSTGCTALPAGAMGAWVLVLAAVRRRASVWAR